VKRTMAMLAVLAALAAGAVPARAGNPEARYRDAAASFHTLEQTPKATADQWRALAQRFRSIYADTPDSRRGADALYSAGLAYREAWQTSVEWRDLSRAVAQFREFTVHFPQDSLADDALMHLASLQVDGFNDLTTARDTYKQLLARYPDGDQHTEAKRRLSSLELVIAAAAQRQRADQAARAAQTPASPAQVASGNAQDASVQTANASVSTVSAQADDGEARPELASLAAASVTGDDDAGPAGGEVRRVQFWSALDLTRVILTTDPGVRYTVNRLGGDAEHPARVYFDLQGEPDDSLPAVTAVGDAVLRQIRISRYDGDTTRVVLDLKHMDRYEVKDFRLPGERKIVVDLHPTAAVIAAARRQAPSAQPATQAGAAPQPVPATNKLPPEPLASLPVGLQIHSIMIDPGHGGHDPGALGYGVAEKDLALQIGKDLRNLIHRHHPELRVGMTRDSDVFIPLQERPQIARRFGADLFVSIHLNANPIKRFHGVETYFLNLTNDRHALQVAARENATSEQGTSALNDILLDLLRDSTLIESGQLAKTVQASLVGTLRDDHSGVRDLGVKQAPFLVLMGAEMPSVLVEVGFITNRRENQRLRESQYLEQIAQGIYDGLGRYIEQQNIVAARRNTPSVAANDQP